MNKLKRISKIGSCQVELGETFTLPLRFTKYATFRATTPLKKAFLRYALDAVVKTVIYALLIIAFFFTGNIYAQNSEVTVTDTTAVPSAYYRANDLVQQDKDLYIAGSYNDERFDIYSVACYWKNGVLSPLTDNKGRIRLSEAKAIAIYKNDVYIIGAFIDTETPSYACWKNGQWKADIDLSMLVTKEESSPYIDIIDMVAYDSDIAILLSEGGQYYYWQKGKLTTLTANETDAATYRIKLDKGITGDTKPYYDVSTIKATALCVYNGDIYITGTAGTEGSYYQKPVYWKNGQLVKLELPASKNKYIVGEATSITVNDKGVWISGQYGPIDKNQMACYWENGQLKELSPWYARAFTTGIFLQGNDVYIAGRMENYQPEDKRMACYWKNGQVVPVFETDSSELYPSVIHLSFSASGQPISYISTTYDYSFNKLSTETTFTIENGLVKPIVLNLPDKRQFATSQVQDVEVATKGDVYALGYTKDAGSSLEKPVFWKNGKKQELTMPLHSSSAKTFAIAVENDNWMVLGYHNDTTAIEQEKYYCYWYNGVYKKFDKNFTPRTVKMINNVVYLTGYKAVYMAATDTWQYQGVYYINDKEYKLAIPKAPGFSTSFPSTMEVIGNKVYIAGGVAMYDKKGEIVKQQAALWVDGVCTIIPAVNPKYKHYAMQIHTVQNKLEVVGTYAYYSTGKNDHSQYVAGGFTWQPGASVKAIPIKAPTIEDVGHALGTEYTPTFYCDVCYSIALLFKDSSQSYALIDVNNKETIYTVNGKVQQLPSAVGKYGSRTYLHSLTIRSGKAYVGGSYYDIEGNEKACYWVDGKRIDLE